MNFTNVEYNQKEIVKIVFKNFLLMLNRRNLLDDIDTLYDNMSENIIENKSIDISLDDKNKIMIYIINGRVTSITQNSPIDEFLSSKTNVKKFLIIKEPLKKTFKQTNENYLNSEIFFLHEFLEDIPAKNYIPKHTLLNKEETEELLQHFELNDFGKILATDMMSRYYGANINDIFRIERPNITSGKGIYYRVVISGKIDMLYTK